MKNHMGRKASISLGLILAVSAGLLSAAPSNAATAPANVSPSVIAPASLYSDSFARQVHDLINVERAKVGSRPFVWNQKIADVSQDWANKLGVATKDPNWDFGTIHRTDAGGTLIPSGASWYRENIGFNGTPQQIVQWWMGSPGHKAAMLDPRGTDAGIGYVVQTSGPYAGLKLVVSNMAAYSSTKAPGPDVPKLPNEPSVPAPVIPATHLNAVDTKGTLWAYETPGTPTLFNRVANGEGWLGIKQLVTVDWNGDGTLDMVAKWGNGYVTYYQGIGGGDYKAPVNIGSGWQDYEIAATKLRNSDTYPGLVAKKLSDGNLFYYPNPGGSVLNGGRIQIGSGWGALSELNAVDWDRDGNIDIVARNSAGSLLLYRTNGNAVFYSEARATIGGGWNIFDSISTEADFDGPGTKGMLARTTTGTLRYYPIIDGKWGTMRVVGSSGWTGYTIASGVIK